MGLMARKPAAALAREMVEILGRGSYEVGGRRVEVRAEVERAVDATEEYPPGRTIALPATGSHATRLECTGETTLEATQRLWREGHSPCALNFASARNPGGGFLNGARAQEESLARSSALYPCLTGCAMYDHHRASSDPLYSDWVIYSPAVPVLREDAGPLLSAPYPCSFLTSPACNAGVALERAGRGGEGVVHERIRAAMARRTERVLAVAAAQGERALVLGAWGCGVFRNDPEEVAELFAQALSGPFAGVFERVIFAVLDTSPEQRFRGPFARRFAG